MSYHVLTVLDSRRRTEEQGAAREGDGRRETGSHRTRTTEGRRKTTGRKRTERTAKTTDVGTQREGVRGLQMLIVS